MENALGLIKAFHEINSGKLSVADFTPSLVGMFGSVGIFDSFLSEVEQALTSGNIPAPLKKRAANLIGTFIPQVAEYNGIRNLAEQQVTAEELRNISAGSLAERRAGVVTILAALIAILQQISE